MNLTRTLIGALLLASGTLNLSASSILIQSPFDNPFAPQELPRGLGANDNIGFLSEVEVGANDVKIGSIGIWGQVVAPTRISWVIYRDVDGSSPIFRTDPSDLLEATGRQWFDSPDFEFTLLGESSYWIGFVVDYPAGSFTTFTEDRFPAEGEDEVLIENGLGLGLFDSAYVDGSFDNPVLDRGEIGTMGIRIYDAPIPEPSATLFMLLGSLAFLTHRARR